MAANQYLIPGGAYANEDTDGREFLIPGGAYLNETSAGAGGGFQAAWASRSNVLLMPGRAA
jgi:hypothetical protein